MSLPFVGQIVASKYQLARMIARGGMGSVWEARHVSLGTPVAVKFMEPQLADSAELRVRFEREAKAAARLQSPHVVQVHDHGVDEDAPYIVMELLHGEDLRARLRRGPMSMEEASRLATHAGRALRVAHSSGIVHRDLKPANVFLVQADDDEFTAKLLDFGIAKGGASSGLDPAESTVTGQLLGSPEYMSPEQARSAKQVDARTDLWSLGVILYAAITGQKPFSGEGVGDLFVKICTESAKPPSAHDPNLPRELDAFFEKALAKDPDARFQSARDMAAAFADIAKGRSGPRPTDAGEGVEARPLPGLSPHTSVPTMQPIFPGNVMVDSAPTISGETLSASSAERRAPSAARGPVRWTWKVAGAAIVAGGAVTAFVLATTSAPSETGHAVSSPPPPATPAAQAAASPPTATVGDVQVTPSEAPSASSSAAAAGSAPLAAPVRTSFGKPKIKPNFGY